MRFKRKRMLQLVLVGCVGWLLILLYTHTSVGQTMDDVWNDVVRITLDSGRLEELMSPSVYTINGTLRNPLDLLVLKKEGILNFYFLPVRRPPSLYTEITSANHDSSYPLAPDFTFHIEYHAKDVLLYKDYGPGCVYRIYILPLLPQDTTRLHQVTLEDLRFTYLKLEIDNRTFMFSMQQMMEGRRWPFLAPINTRHARPASGVGSYTPFCYQEKIKISYQHDKKLPPNLFEQMINCSKNDFECPIHIYSGISRHKFTPETKVPAFNTRNMAEHKKATAKAASLLQKPERFGPDNSERCEMDCLEMCSDCQHNLLRTNKPGVVAAIKMRVFETATSKPVANWNNLFLTASFDGAIIPQINKVPLGSLFGATGSMNEFSGAAMGRKKQTCSYSDALLDIPANSITSYLYFPMPFWRNALITIEGSHAVDTSLLVCYKLTVVENHYKEEDTAYFHAVKTIYSDAVDGYRTMLQLNASWGHIVGLQMEVENLKAKRDVPINERWAALQADMVLYIDEANSPTMMGTGLEDYFSYAHGFTLAENTSYAFVGVYHSGPRRSEPLTWHFYRLHILDPITFQNSVHFLAEGTKEDYYKPQKPLDWDEYKNILTEGGCTLSHLVLYYAREQAGSTRTDALIIGSAKIEQHHQFMMLPPLGKSVPERGYLESRRYYGNTISGRMYMRMYRMFEALNSFIFVMKVFLPNKGVILRREFYTPLKVWNLEADVVVNGKLVGTWFIPFGTLAEGFCLRQDDFLIGPEITNQRTDLRIQIAPKTTWYDIAYVVYVIH